MRSIVSKNNTYYELAKVNKKYWQVKTYKIEDNRSVLIDTGRLYKTKSAAEKDYRQKIEYSNQGFAIC